MLKHSYLKFAIWTKWESSCQACTLTEVQLKLNLKPDYWHRVKYKNAVCCFILLFFLNTTFKNLPPRSNITPPIAHLPTKLPWSVIQADENCNTIQALEKNTIRDEQRGRDAFRFQLILGPNDVSENRIKTHIHYYRTRTEREIITVFFVFLCFTFVTALDFVLSAVCPRRFDAKTKWRSSQSLQPDSSKSYRKVFSGCLAPLIVPFLLPTLRLLTSDQNVCYSSCAQRRNSRGLLFSSLIQ